MERPIRVLVVDDSAFMRRVISDMINEEADMEVIGTAVDGVDAIDKCCRDRPDVVTMDIAMPNMDGITALERIMERCPTPVLMLTGISKEEADVTIRSFERGAVDFIAKPSGQISLDIHKIRAELVEKIRNTAHVSVKGIKIIPSSPVKADKAAPVELKVVVIGASTGGPQAITEVLSKMPKGLNYSVLVVQHMPPTFTRSFADRLKKNAGINAKEAEEGDIIEDGIVLIAPGDRHMKVKLRRIEGKLKPTITLTDEPKVHNVRPSIDLLMESAAEVFGKNVVAVVLTGMGRDGASGMETVKAHKGVTLVQDEDTSTVFGMPKATQERIQVDRVVALQDMAREITEMICRET
jgi:two-component system chemotaxis response regulator CheB